MLCTSRPIVGSAPALKVEKIFTEATHTPTNRMIHKGHPQLAPLLFLSRPFFIIHILYGVLRNEYFLNYGLEAAGDDN